MCRTKFAILTQTLLIDKEKKEKKKKKEIFGYSEKIVA